MTTFFVKGEPVPKQSFRVVEKRSGKTTHGYANPRVVSWQNAIGYEANSVVFDVADYYRVSLDFFLSNKRRVDIDNLSKAVLDGLKGIAFKDDNQVIQLSLTKQVSKDPGVLIEVVGI